ncbi:hypothetical protein [Algicola sagamiensis]|uniref:hypothetical protein n=1 Tax=Algicola sagamiensis TaxID=163869 RepID=UPI0012FB33CE|nr:hypothetical protein [Algicola sagamiensis]
MASSSFYLEKRHRYQQSVVTASLTEGPNCPVMPAVTEILEQDVIKRDGEINAWDHNGFRKTIEKSGRKKSLWLAS